MSEARAAKTAVVEEIQDKLSNAESVIVTEYRGLTVDALRIYAWSSDRWREVQGVQEHLGPPSRRLPQARCLIYLQSCLLDRLRWLSPTQTPEGELGDVVAVAKALKDFSKSQPDLVIKGGLFEGSLSLTPRDLMPSPTSSHAKYCLRNWPASLAAPMQRMAGLLGRSPPGLCLRAQGAHRYRRRPRRPRRCASPAREAAAAELRQLR